MRDTPWPILQLKTSVGDLRDVLGITKGLVSVGGVEVEFYACIIPEQFAEDSEYDLLLGIPWLSGMKASINVEKSQVTIIAPKSGAPITLDGPKFSCHNFKKLFLDFTLMRGTTEEGNQRNVAANFQGMRIADLDDEDAYTTDDEFSSDNKESESDEEESEEEIWGPPPLPKARSG